MTDIIIISLRLMLIAGLLCVLQRTHRHELFTPPVIGSAPDEGRNKFQVRMNTAVCGG